MSSCCGPNQWSIGWLSKWLICTTTTSQTKETPTYRKSIYLIGGHILTLISRIAPHFWRSELCISISLHFCPNELISLRRFQSITGILDWYIFINSAISLPVLPIYFTQVRKGENEETIPRSYLVFGWSPGLLRIMLLIISEEGFF